MNITSHFVWISLDPIKLSNIFERVSKYIEENWLEDIVVLQDSNTPHITLYYLEKDLSNIEKKDIQQEIKNFDVSEGISINGMKYFYRESEKYVVYLVPETIVELEEYRNFLHKKYMRDWVVENSFSFMPHVTVLKILDSIAFESHRENIERLIQWGIVHILGDDTSTHKVYLYEVDANENPERQVALGN